MSLAVPKEKVWQCLINSNLVKQWYSQAPYQVIEADMDTWADVINDARAKLRFINQQLSYEADRDSAKEYLLKTHAKFIPDVPEFVANEDSAEIDAEEVHPVEG